MVRSVCHFIRLYLSEGRAVRPLIYVFTIPDSSYVITHTERAPLSSHVSMPCRTKVPWPLLDALEPNIPTREQSANLSGGRDDDNESQIKHIFDVRMAMNLSTDVCPSTSRLRLCQARGYSDFCSDY